MKIESSLKHLHFAISLISISFAALFSTSCSNNEPDIPLTKARHTLLVYMAACNSLGASGYDIDDINEMKRAVNHGALGNDCRLLVFHTNNKGISQLIEITPQGEKLLKTYSSADGLTSVHGARLSGVIDDTKKYAPASSTGLILWSHGNGWLQNGMTDSFNALNNNNRSITIEPSPDAIAHSWGEENGRTMNITTLAKALEGKDISYIYFDCCYMASIEVAYQLRNVTPIIAASAIELPAEGMPYDKTLQYFFSSTPQIELAAKTTFNYYNSKQGENRTCAMSVIKTNTLDRLAAKSAQIIKASQRNTPQGFSPQRFMTESRCMFFDMQQYYRAMAEYANIMHIFNEWQNLLDETITYAAATPRLWNRLDIKYHCGLSSYILTPDADLTDTYTHKNYHTLDWYNNVVKQTK